MTEQRGPTRELLQHSEVVSPQTHQLDTHKGVGQRDTALIKPIEDGDQYFVKCYSTTSEAYKGYPGRAILFDISMEHWEGDEPPGAGQYEYNALQQIKSKLGGATESTALNVVIPEPVEYVPEHSALILGYIEERSNLRNKLFPYSHPAICRRFNNTSNSMVDIAAELAVNIRAIHESTQKESTLNVTSYLSSHKELFANSTLPQTHPGILDKLTSVTYPTLPVCYSHGDFIPRNILQTSNGELSFIDWNLMTAAHPFIDVHRFNLDLWRWSFFPLANSTELDRIRNTFGETYLSLSNLSYYSYIFTKVTALLRFYHLYIDTHTGVSTMIYRRMIGKISKEIDRCLRILNANGSSRL